MENKPENTQNFAKKIEEAIRDKKIKMKPRWYFVFKSIMIISFISILLLAMIYVGNFILFIFHEHKRAFDILNIDPFGFRAILEFIKTIPALLILLIILFIFSLYKLIKEYSFVYRKNILYIILFLIVFIVAAVANIHLFLDREFQIARFGERGEIPFLQNVHRYYLGDKFLENENNLPPVQILPPADPRDMRFVNPK